MLKSHAEEGEKVLRPTKVEYPFYHSKNEKGLNNFCWKFLSSTYNRHCEDSA